jgi:hypothetical protein
MNNNPGDEILRIQQEYEQEQLIDLFLQNPLYKQSTIGTIIFDFDLKALFVCNGRINGKATWSKIGDING